MSLMISTCTTEKNTIDKKKATSPAKLLSPVGCPYEGTTIIYDVNVFGRLTTTRKQSCANKQDVQTNNSCQEGTLGTLHLYIILRVAKEFFFHISYHLKKATL